METKELLKKVRKIEIKSKGLSNQIFSGEYHSAFKGQGMAFSEVREYIPGDPVRIIDWNVTARLNKPYVKVFEEERELTVMLLIDISASEICSMNSEIVSINGISCSSVDFDLVSGTSYAFSTNNVVYLKLKGASSKIKRFDWIAGWNDVSWPSNFDIASNDLCSLSNLNRFILKGGGPAEDYSCSVPGYLREDFIVTKEDYSFFVEDDVSFYAIALVVGDFFYRLRILLFGLPYGVNVLRPWHREWIF